MTLDGNYYEIVNYKTLVFHETKEQYIDPDSYLRYSNGWKRQRQVLDCWLGIDRRRCESKDSNTMTRTLGGVGKRNIETKKNNSDDKTLEEHMRG